MSAFSKGWVAVLFQVEGGHVDVEWCASRASEVSKLVQVQGGGAELHAGSGDEAWCRRESPTPSLGWPTQLADIVGVGGRGIARTRAGDGDGDAAEIATLAARSVVWVRLCPRSGAQSGAQPGAHVMHLCPRAAPRHVQQDSGGGGLA